MLGLPQHLRMLARIRESRAKHKLIAEGMLCGIAEVGITQLTEVVVGIPAARSFVEVARKICISTADDLCENVITD